MEVVVDREREHVRLVSHPPQQVADAPSRVANRIAAMRGRHPLIDDHDASACTSLRFGQRLERRRPEGPDLVHLLRLGHLSPEVESHRRTRTRRCASHPVDELEQCAGKILPFEPLEGFVLAVHDAGGQIPIRSDGVDQGRDSERILVVVEDARAVHGPRHGRGGKRQDRHAHVERLHQRHTEAFVLTRAEEDVGQLVVGGELGVADVTQEMHVRHSEPVDHVLQHRDVALETGMRPDQEEPRTRIEPLVVRVEGADDIVDALVGDHPPHEQHVDPGIVEDTGLHEIRLVRRGERSPAPRAGPRSGGTRCPRAPAGCIPSHPGRARSEWRRGRVRGARENRAAPAAGGCR